MQTIYLDISSKGVYPCIYAKQGDIGRKFLAVITDNGVPFAIPEVANVSAWYESKSSAGSFGSLSVTDNTVEVTIDQQMTVVAESGVVCISVVYENGDEISTWNIPYDIESKPGINPVVPGQPPVSGSQIDDSVVSATKTWSSKKINDAIGELESRIASGITTEEKALILSLFRDATYTKNVYSTLEQLANLWGMEIPWVKVIPVEELYSGYGLYPNRNTVNGETKYAQTSTTRTSYLDFIEIEAGATYKFEWDGPIGRQICIEAYNTSAMSAVVGNYNFVDADRWSSGWGESQTTGCQFTIPTEVNGKPILTMRFTFNSTSGPTGDVTITKVVV